MACLENETNTLAMPACSLSKDNVAPMPHAYSKSHIPRLQRSSSLRLRGERPLACNHAEQTNGTSQPNGHNRSTKPESLAGTTRTFRKPSGGAAGEGEPVDLDDAVSVRSGVSCASFMSCDINAFHPQDQSSSSASVHSLQGPCKKYVLHCQRHIAPAETKYLTPTQRKDRHIRQLKAALVRATRGWEEKEVEIQRLKSEVERLRFSYSQSATSGSQQLCESPTTILEEDADSLDGATGAQTQEAPSNSGESKSAASVRPSSLNLNGNADSQLHCLEDSGILSDLPEPHFFHNSLMNSKDTPTEAMTQACKNLNFASILKETNTSNKETQTFGGHEQQKFSLSRGNTDNNMNNILSKNKGLWEIQGESNYESVEPFSGWQNEVEEQKRKLYVEVQELKEKHNNRIESLLHKLSDLNAKYFEMRSAYEKSLERIRQLDTQSIELRKEMTAQEEWHSQMYLKMYRKGQEAAKFEHADEVLEFAHKAPKRVSVPELLQQLHKTEHELEETKQAYRCEMYRHATTGDNHQAEYTLKFLKDAVFYYLTEKDNKGHLRAIESILGFNEKERATVARSQRLRKSIV